MFGRKNEISAFERWSAEVEGRLDPAPLCFLGTAGAGKTSLLKYARKELRAKNWICGYSEASSDAGNALEDFLEDIRRSAPGRRISSQTLSRLTGLTVSGLGVGASVKLGPGADRTRYQRVFDLLATLGKLSMKSGSGVALLIDEAQVLPEADLRLLFRVANSLDGYPVSLMIAGLPGTPSRIAGETRRSRRDEDRDEDWDSDKSTGPLVRIVPYMQPLTTEESILDLSIPVQEADGRFASKADIMSLVAFAEGHPLTLRMLGAAAWEAADDGSENHGPVINSEHVSWAIRSATEQLRWSYHEPMWTQSSSRERDLLLAIASQTESIHVPSLCLLVKQPQIDVYDVFYSLRNRGVVHDSDFASFAIPGFRQFLQRNSSGMTTPREATVRDRARRFFQRALGGVMRPNQ